MPDPSAPFSVREIESTPNPNALKFVLNRPIIDRPMSYLNPEAGQDDPLAARLFAIEGVASLLFLNDFITVNKHPDAKWEPIRRAVRQVLTGK